MALIKELFKDLVFCIYGIFFNLGAASGVKENRIGLISMHNAHFTDGLGEVEAEFKFRSATPVNELEAGYAPFHQGEFKTPFEFGGKVPYEFIKVERCDLFESKLSALKFLTFDAFRMGRAKLIFLNDNFMALGFCKPNVDTKIVQLWHGQGAFKKFGLSIDVAPADRRRELAANKRLSYVVCSSVGVKDIYAEAFGVDESQVLPLGSPTSDYYFRDYEISAAKENVYKQYPELKGKYVILYAPTFRANGLNVLDKIDISKIVDENTVVLTRLHPQVNGGEKIPGTIDVTNYPNVNELCVVSDMLITDYSSICMDFALLEKPIVFYAYDLGNYRAERGFYFDYESYVGGPVAKTNEELISAINDIRATNKAPKQLSKFRMFNFDNPDGKATERLAEKLSK